MEAVGEDPVVAVEGEDDDGDEYGKGADLDNGPDLDKGLEDRLSLSDPEAGRAGTHDASCHGGWMGGKRERAGAASWPAPRGRRGEVRVKRRRACVDGVGARIGMMFEAAQRASPSGYE